MSRHFPNRHAVDADILERLPDFFELVWLNNGFNFFIVSL